MAHKEVDHALHAVVGHVFQVGDVEKFPQALGFKGRDLFSHVSQPETRGGWK